MGRWLVWFSAMVLWVATASTAGVAMEKISLLPILDQLGVGTGDIQGIPITCAQDIVGIGDGDFDPKRLKWSGRIEYPIAHFAASPSLGRAAFSTVPIVHERGSTTPQLVNVVEIREGRAELARQIAPLEEKTSLSSFEFVADDRLRIERVASGGKLGYRRVIEFFDLSTGTHVSFESLLEPVPGPLIGVRPFSKSLYLVGYLEKTGPDEVDERYAFYWLPPGAAVARRIRETNQLGLSGQQLGVALFHNPVDERDVFETADDGAWIRTEIPVDGRWERRWFKVSETKLEMASERGVEEGAKFPVRGTAGYRTIQYEERRLTLLAPTGRPILIWKLPNDAVWSAVQRVPGGYVAEMANHPLYGFLWLGDDGSVRELTRERMIFHRTSAAGILGVSNLNRHGTVDLMRVTFNAQRR